MSNYQDVLAAVREYVRDPENGSFDIWGPRWALEKRIPDSTWRQGTLTPGYNAQVLRAVSALVEEGTLIKEGEGRDARYWTPAARERALERDRQEDAARTALRERWGRVQIRLAARGYGAIRSSELDLRLPLEEWERLLGELEAGQQRVPAEGMVLYDVARVPGLRAGVISESGAVVLLAPPLTVMNDPASVTALQQALEQAHTDQVRIHRRLYLGKLADGSWKD